MSASAGGQQSRQQLQEEAGKAALAKRGRAGLRGTFQPRLNPAHQSALCRPDLIRGEIPGGRLVCGRRAQGCPAGTPLPWGRASARGQHLSGVLDLVPAGVD